MRYEYPAEIDRDEAGHYLVSIPDVPEAVTDAIDREEALADAAGALSAALAGYVHKRCPLPVPSPAGGRPMVAVPGLVAAKLALYEAMRERGMFTARELAHALGKSQTAARRLMDPDYSSKWESVEEALATLGHHLVIEAA
jgi:antitoxin HicB